MKTIFIPAKAKTETNKNKILEISKKLPKKIAITYSVQYQDIAKKVKEILSEDHQITSLTQVLGCSSPKFPINTEAVILIGSGKFHAVSLAFETKLPIYILNKDNLEKVSEEEVQSLEKKHKASQLKFLTSKKVGILISTKPGQQNLERALSIKKKLKDKKSYMFISNNINPIEFENFGLNCWINTACQRIDFNTQVINMNEI
jgi:diphthamide biosynthesis enzyme Dph1/Dph2-like protein